MMAGLPPPLPSSSSAVLPPQRAAAVPPPRWFLLRGDERRFLLRGGQQRFLLHGGERRFLLRGGERRFHPQRRRWGEAGDPVPLTLLRQRRRWGEAEEAVPPPTSHSSGDGVKREIQCPPPSSDSGGVGKVGAPNGGEDTSKVAGPASRTNKEIAEEEAAHQDCHRKMWELIRERGETTLKINELVGELSKAHGKKEVIEHELAELQRKGL